MKVHIKLYLPLILIILFSLTNCATVKKAPVIYPGETWERSTPEAQGVDSEKLLTAFKLLDLPKSAINSMVVIRNGYIITEYYRQPFTKKTRQMINSCTKSFTSTLMGIAIDEGLIESKDELVMPYFPDYSHDDPRAAEMTIEDLLTMRSGFQWNEWELPITNPENDWHIVLREYDKLGYIFSKPFVLEPGEAFYYNTMNTQLITDIIHRATDRQFVKYAEDKLLNPIGINSWAWKKTSEGSPLGGATMVMTTEDLARLGYLYLNEGMWDGKQIVSTKWIQDSVKPHTQILTRGYENKNFHYGYQWWIFDEDSYTASGSHGQYCFVRPDKNLVIAINSYEEGIRSIRRTESMLTKEIPSSCISEKPLSANPEKLKTLNEYIISAEEARPVGLFISPDSLKEKLNNKQIVFDDENLTLKSIILNFTDNNEINAVFKYLQADNKSEEIKLKFDLDKKFDNRTYDIANPWFFGTPEIQQYYRITSIQKDSITYEIVEPGIFNRWYTVTLKIEGNEVEFRQFIKTFGSWNASSETSSIMKGRIVE